MWRPAPPSIEPLLAQHGLAACRVRQLADLDCSVWRIAAPDGAADLCLRIYPAERADPMAIDTEIDWLCRLADAGVPVPRPQPTRGSAYRMAWQAEPQAQPRHAVLLHWLPGRMLYRGLRVPHLQRMGRLAARLHHGIQLPASGPERTAYLPSIEAMARGEMVLPATFPEGLQHEVGRAASRLLQLMQPWPRDTTHCGFIHGDLHPWNIVFHQGQAGAFDFTDCGAGWYALDLAAMLQFIRHPLTPQEAHLRTAYPWLRSALLDAYATEHGLPDSLLAQLEPLIAMRLLTTLQWMVEDWPRPDLRPWGPGFLADLPRALDEALG